MTSTILSCALYVPCDSCCDSNMSEPIDRVSASHGAGDAGEGQGDRGGRGPIVDHVSVLLQTAWAAVVGSRPPLARLSTPTACAEEATAAEAPREPNAAPHPAAGATPVAAPAGVLEAPAAAPAPPPVPPAAAVQESSSAQPMESVDVERDAAAELARWDARQFRQQLAAPTPPATGEGGTPSGTHGRATGADAGGSDYIDYEVQQLAILRQVVRDLEMQTTQELTTGDPVEQRPSGEVDGWNVARGVWSSSQQLLPPPLPLALPHRVMARLFPAQPFPPPRPWEALDPPPLPGQFPTQAGRSADPPSDRFRY